jgi:hypothetical protein
MLATAFATIAAVSAGKSKGISAEHLSKVWSILHEDVACTLQVTTQRLRHDADSSLSRNFGTNDRAVRYKKLKSYFFSDTLFVTGKAKSSRGNICAQLFVLDKGFVAIYPMQHQRDYFLALRQFAKGDGSARGPCLRSSSDTNAAKSQRVLYPNWDNTQENSMGKLR